MSFTLQHFIPLSSSLIFISLTLNLSAANWQSSHFCGYVQVGKSFVNLEHLPNAVQFVLVPLFGTILDTCSSNFQSHVLLITIYFRQKTPCKWPQFHELLICRISWYYYFEELLLLRTLFQRVLSLRKIKLTSIDLNRSITT